MEYAGLYTHEIGVARHEYTPTTPLLVNPPNVRHLDVIGRAEQSVRRTRDKETLTPVCDGPPYGTSWTRSWDQHEALCERLRQWHASLLARSPDSYLTELEAEHAGKMCLQSGGMWAWDVRPDGIGLKGGDPIAAEYKAIWSILDRADYQPYLTSVPKDTNCGWPFFITGASGKMLQALAVAACGRDLGDTRTLLSWAAREIGAHDEAHSLLLSRTGPIAKAQPAYARIGPSIARVGDIRGVAPRRRAVNGVSSADNLNLLFEAKGMQACLQAHPSFRHTHPGLTLDKIRAAFSAIEERGGTPVIFEDDISSFDLSVRGSHQRSLQKQVYEPVWGAKQASYWCDVQWSPLMAPPTDLRFTATLYEKPEGGETTSGMITTSVDGNMHNLACLLACLQAGCRTTLDDVVDRINDGRIFFLMWGDDTVLVLDEKGFDPEAYVERGRQVGYTRKLRGRQQAGATFLSVFYDTRRWVWHSLNARDAINTVFREHPPIGPASEVAGMYARLIPRRAELNPHFGELWTILAGTSDLFERFRIKQPRDLGRLMESPTFQDLVRAETAAQAQKSMQALLALREGVLRGDPGSDALASWLEAIVGLNTTDAEIDVMAAVAGIPSSEARRLFTDAVAEMATTGRVPTNIKNLTQEI